MWLKSLVRVVIAVVRGCFWYRFGKMFFQQILRETLTYIFSKK